MSEAKMWKIGDRCQIDRKGNIRVGNITSVEMEQEEGTKYNFYLNRHHQERYTKTVVKFISVKWDDGEEQQGLGQYDVYSEDTEMERAFRLAVEDAQSRIDSKVDEARTALREAVRISEETGIPFSAGVSPLRQSYIPNSLAEKFPGVDREFYSDIAGAWGEYEGWQHSQVC